MALNTFKCNCLAAVHFKGLRNCWLTRTCGSFPLLSRYHFAICCSIVPGDILLLTL